MAGANLTCASCLRRLRPARGSGDVRRTGNLGTRLDGYQLVALLGEGHTHDVYSANHDDGFSVALKLPRSSWDGDLVDLAIRDYTLLRALDHPHFVRIHEYRRSSQLGVYAAYELVELESLEQVAPVPWRRAVGIVRQMCEPLHAVATCGLFSRKLSARHVFLEQRAPMVAGGQPYRGFVEAADFVKIMLGTNAGAKPPALLTEVRGYFGDLDSTAPELLGGSPGHERCYVFTLGAFAYFLSTGKWPFGELSFPARFLPATFIAPSALVPDVPKALDDVIATCLAYEPSRRYSSTLALREVLEAF